MLKSDGGAAPNGERTTPLVIPASALRQVSEWEAWNKKEATPGHNRISGLG